VAGTYRGRRPNFDEKPSEVLRDPDMEESTKTLAESLSIVKVQRVQLKRYLDMDHVMDALKSASTMLSELRTSSLTPKHYYELYMAVLDALRHLSIYLYDAHTGGKHHLADLYELVQYCGHIVPRLYLMITVGSVYMSVPDAPVREIMKDMTEMSRGVQHPTRGLFLRHYLSTTTRDHLPTGSEPGPAGDLSDSISFVLANFVEMNRLWVRQQHLGHSREREKREMERRELRILVGTNLVRLSQLDGVSLELYQQTILPSILEQVIHCKDAIAQEYLMDVIIQVFPDDFHLHTLHLVLSACTQLHPKVSVKQLVIAMINRLAAYASREADNEAPEERQRQEDAARARLAAQVRARRPPSTTPPPSHIWYTIAQEQSTKRDSWRLLLTDLEHALPDDGDNIWSDTARPTPQPNLWEPVPPEAPVDADEAPAADLPAPPATFRGIPHDVHLFEVFWEQIQHLMQARTDLSMQDISALLLSLLNLSLNCYPDRLEYVDQVLGFAREKLSEALEAGDSTVLAPQSHFHMLLLAPIQAYDSALTLLGLPQFHALWSMQLPLTQRAIAQAIVSSMLRRHTLVSSPADVDGILGLCAPLLQYQPDVPDPSLPAQAAILDELHAQHGALARLVHLFYADDVQVHLALLHTVRQHYSQGGDAMRHIFPPLILDAIALLRRVPRESAWERKVRTLFQFVHQLIAAQYHAVETPELCVRLFLLAAEVADEARIEDVAYDMFVHAFTIFEESLTDSRAQLQAIGLVISTLHKARVFGTDNYQTLATKAALYSAKLLKRPQQATAVLMASHLWWQTPTDDAPYVRNGRRVLECLQKTLRIADACMDPHASLEMLCNALSKYIYYFELGVDTVSTQHINSLTSLLAQALDGAPTDDPDTPPASWHTAAPVDAPTQATRRHLVHLLRYVEMRKREALEQDSSPTGPDWHGLQTKALLSRMT